MTVWPPLSTAVTSTVTAPNVVTPVGVPLRVMVVPVCDGQQRRRSATAIPLSTFVVTVVAPVPPEVVITTLYGTPGDETAGKDWSTTAGSAR